MTAMNISGDWIERVCFAGVTGATAASLRHPDGPAINLRMRLAVRETWRLGPDQPVAAAIAPRQDVDRLEEDAERWDGLS